MAFCYSFTFDIMTVNSSVTGDPWKRFFFTTQADEFNIELEDCSTDFLLSLSLSSVNL